MSAAKPYRCRGMTLVELLVVISILGLLAVTVIPNFANTGDRRKVREAARAISSFMAGGQSRALGSRAGGGVWFDPLSSTISSGTLSIGAAIDMAEADVPAPYAGDSTLSTVTFGTASPAAWSPTVTFAGGCTPPSGSNNLIRFGNSTTLFSLSVLSGSTATVSMRSSASQTASNTSWPRPSTAVNYEIIGPPTRSPASTLTLGNGVAIDLYHSCSGTNRFPNLSSTLPLLSSGTTPFQIIYDRTSRPEYLACAGARTAINETIYLIVAPIESIQSSGTASNNSLAPTDGYWVAIDPRGGIPKVAEVYASGTTLFQQQKYIREGAVQLGR